MKSKRDILVSVVIALEDRDIPFLEDYLKKLHAHLDHHYNDYEMIVLDRNTDISYRLKKDILEDISSIRWIKATYLVDVKMLLNIGIENAIGDYMIYLRAIIDPPSLIHEMVTKCSKYDMVVGVADYPKTLGYKIVRRISKKLLDSIDYHLPQNATPVRCLRRKTINMILSTGQNRQKIFSKASIPGCSITGHHYQLDCKSVKKKSVLSGIMDMLRLMVFNSKKTLKWISSLGILGSFCSFVFALYSILINFVKDNVVEGWTTMVFFFSLLFMMLFIILAFLGEYMERILRETSNQQGFYVLDEERSSFMIKTDRFNVID